MNTAFVNGEFLPLAQARVSVLDRGFLFADSVYEVVPFYAGRGFRLDEHLDRLARSLGLSRIRDPYDRPRWHEIIAGLIDANGGGDLSLYIQVTRGAPARRDHRIPDDIEPTVVAFCQSRAPVDPAVLAHGIAAVTHDDTRWRYCTIKSTSLLANVLAADQARAQGASEALVVRDGCIQEGTSSNVFAVIDDRLVTPALRDTILPGITRAAVLELAAREQVEHAEVETLLREDLQRASEIWITSSVREIFPVTELDGACVGNGKPGPLWTRMHAALQAMPHD
ncbi:D-amino-acid transaminase [Salinisphaera sp. C84B14]|uniref:D-amino acid aminotransferase n=1 Tax=Salinisphaera sp. C84B14 TaxID=1304155 RepID=UPI003341CC22